jgi:hypothetical protein
LRIRQGIQQSNHRKWDRAAANEIYLALENVVGIVVKADNESSHDFDAVALNGAD